MILVMFIPCGHLTAQVSHMAHSHKVLDLSAVSFPAQLEGAQQLVGEEVEMLGDRAAG